MSQLLSSADLVDRELAQLQDTIHQSLRTITDLQGIKRDFNELQVTYLQTQELQGRAQKVLGEAVEQQQAWQSSLAKYEQRWQEMEKAWAKAQNDLQTQQQNLTQLVQKLQANHDDQWKRLEASWLKDQHDLWIAVNNLRTDMGESTKANQEQLVAFVAKAENLSAQTLVANEEQGRRFERLEKENQEFGHQLIEIQKSYQRKLWTLRWLLFFTLLLVLSIAYNLWRPMIAPFFPVVIHYLQAFGIKP